MITRLTKTFFKLLGFNIEKISNKKLVDARESSNDPRAAYYENYFQIPVLITAKLSDGRGLDIFSLSKDSIHPFISSIRQLKNVDKDGIKKVLTNYYQEVTPTNPLDWLGVSDYSYDSPLKAFPAWNTLLPWENISIDIKSAERTICALQDNKEHGKKLDISFGWRNFGPVSDDILELETNRVWSLYKSIKNNGFIRGDHQSGDIGAVVLMKADGSWRWLVESGGQHRAAILGALGYQSTPIRIWKIVREEDVMIWPAVIKGYYSVGQAIQIFNNIFDADVQNITTNWSNYLKV